MPLHSDKNLYPGINPHLNSELQQPDNEWASFHTDYITFTRELLDKLLPEDYYVASETSLQIGTCDRFTDQPLAKPSKTIPDIIVLSGSASASAHLAPIRGNPTLTLPLIDTIDEEEELSAVVIYHAERGNRRGRPVTRIELLSPANKLGGSHYASYLTKRKETLYSGLRLIEIDYLHEKYPLLARIPSYPDRDTLAFPYAVIVSDPRPSVEDGITSVFNFGVLDNIPVIDIPLEGADFVTLDFGIVYNRTMESSKMFRRILVDYEQEPVNFAAYHEADQLKIREQMTKIAAEYKLNL